MLPLKSLRNPFFFEQRALETCFWVRIHFESGIQDSVTITWPIGDSRGTYHGRSEADSPSSPAL